MAGQKFEYDESGSTFLYFLISVLGLILIPCTYIFWASKDDAVKIKNKDEACECKGCLEKEVRLKKPEKWKAIKLNLLRGGLLMGWVFMAILVYKVQEFDYEYANFDPYDILSVGTQASQADIKKAYRKLSLLYHPDKPTGDERKFMKLNKAYQALTDDTARRNYELYGNPDGPGAMNFGIALPSWIVEKENSLWVLGLYALVFMIAMPTVVAVWWYRSSKFSNDQVLLDTTQLYYYFFHKSSEMNFRRVLMILGASLEFERGHNHDIKDRLSDCTEVPALIRQMAHMNDKNKERPLCFPYAVKARALLYAHLTRIKLNADTLDLDRFYVVKLCPSLVGEMVTCVSQLMMLAHAGRISRLPSLETIEATMALAPHVVQAVPPEGRFWLMQLPHVTEDMARYCQLRKKQVTSVAELWSLSADDQRAALKGLTAAQMADVQRVGASFPRLRMTVHYEVVDDDDTGVFTAGAIVTVTLLLTRTSLGDACEADMPKKGTTPGAAPPVSKKSKKAEKALAGRRANAPNPASARARKANNNNNAAAAAAAAVGAQKKGVGAKKAASQSETTTTTTSNWRRDDDDDESDGGKEGGAPKTEQEEDAEWERFQRGLTKKEKVLEAKTDTSHKVHCPFFTDEKSEFWWAYVCDRKKHMLTTAPYQITNLEDELEVQLKFTAPSKPGQYAYEVWVRSDAYLGADAVEPIRLDVKEAPKVPTAHPQWDECQSSDEEDDEDRGEGSAVGGGGGGESEYTTDDEATDDESD